MISIIDYGVGNINAFVNLYKRVNIPVSVAKTNHDLRSVEKLVLPGVGHFDYAMDRLNNSGMRERIDELVLNERKPIIGICVGMQMMAKGSEEGTRSGLGWIDAEVKRFDESTIRFHTKVPHMGWNDVNPKPGNNLFRNLESDAMFYFLHTYYIACNEDDNSIATTEYGNSFTCAVKKEHIYGIQFHPEKSHHYGEVLMTNFASL